MVVPVWTLNTHSGLYWSLASLPTAEDPLGSTELSAARTPHPLLVSGWTPVATSNYEPGTF